MTFRLHMDDSLDWELVMRWYSVDFGMHAETEQVDIHRVALSDARVHSFNPILKLEVRELPASRHPSHCLKSSNPKKAT